MHTHQGLVLGLFVIQGCIPAEERDDSSARHYSGAEWRLDPNGNVVGTTAVLVERVADGAYGHVTRVGSDAGADADDVFLGGTLRHGVFRVVELRADGRRVVELTPVSASEYDERRRAR